VLAIVLSDVLGDALDTIASGPAYPDASTCADAEAIVAKYGLDLPPNVRRALGNETPKALDNVTTEITGSVRELCAATAEACRELGYRPYVLTTTMACEAREAGSLLGAMARDARGGAACFEKPAAIILGGETVVHLRGRGLGGRNQELAAAAGLTVDGLADVCVFSLGSDGTDGPTDAAGGIVTGEWAQACRNKGLNVAALLMDNDAYHLLKASDALLTTGPTGTNVNDVSVALIR
jgi:hydroxypyruvate reductase